MTDCNHPHTGFHLLTIIWRHRQKPDSTGKAPCKNCGNRALTVPGHLASLLLNRSSSVVCKSLNPSSARGGEQTQPHQPKDWQLWFMLKCFLLGQIVSTEKMQVASSDKKAGFPLFSLFFFFFFPSPLPHTSFLWWAQLVFSLFVH